jgi:hypothetical protein
MLRDVIDGHMIGDVCRSLLAGAATVLLIGLLPVLSPLLAIPLCILAFAGLALLFGAVRRADAEMLRTSLKKKQPPVPATSPHHE